MAKKYRDVDEQLETIDTYAFEGDLDRVIDFLQRFKETYGNHRALRMVENGGYDHTEFVLLGTRSETDKERDKRLATARKEREKKKARAAELETKEREELARLQAKYND